MAVQLSGARDHAPFSVEITGPDGSTLLNDPKFLMDYRSRDPKRCAELAKEFKDKLSDAGNKGAMSAVVTSLPISFLQSHLPTKVEYEQSLRLSEDARLKAESDAIGKKIEAMKMVMSQTPTASIASSASGRNDDPMVDVTDDSGCCGGDSAKYTY